MKEATKLPYKDFSRNNVTWGDVREEILQSETMRRGSVAKKTFLLIGNGDHRNRGCEAITMGTITILKKIFGPEICVVDRPISEVGVPIPLSAATQFSNYSYDPIMLKKKFSAVWWLRRLCLEIPILTKALARLDAILMMRNRLNHNCVVLSLGGDNYTLDYSIPYTFVEHGKYARKHKNLFFIWGATVGPFHKNPTFSKSFMAHLQADVTGVFAREGRTEKYLKENGIQHVFTMTDPAFVMAPQAVSASILKFELPTDAIGINLSPIMNTYSHGGDYDQWVANATEIIERLKERFKSPLVLIPHVTIGDRNNDFIFMKTCFDRLSDKTGCYLLDDSLNAQQTKWVISKMKCIVASRTHATIAGFSTCTPTVSLAYSTKALGINEDLFGHTRYVVMPEELNSDSVIRVTETVIAEAPEIKQTLLQNMTDIVDKAFDAGRQLQSMVEEYHDA